MQSTDIEEIKAALWLQACHGCTFAAHRWRCGNQAMWHGLSSSEPIPPRAGASERATSC